MLAVAASVHVRQNGGSTSKGNGDRALRRLSSRLRSIFGQATAGAAVVPSGSSEARMSMFRPLAMVGPARLPIISGTHIFS